MEQVLGNGSLVPEVVADDLTPVIETDAELGAAHAAGPVLVGVRAEHVVLAADDGPDAFAAFVDFFLVIPEGAVEAEVLFLHDFTDAVLDPVFEVVGFAAQGAGEVGVLFHVWKVFVRGCPRCLFLLKIFSLENFQRWEITGAVSAKRANPEGGKPLTDAGATDHQKGKGIL